MSMYSHYALLESIQRALCLSSQWAQIERNDLFIDSYEGIGCEHNILIANIVQSLYYFVLITFISKKRVSEH